MHAFESFAMRCPQEVSPFRQELLDTCMKFIEYDPNYNYDDSDEEMEDYSDDEFSEGEYSDDDDTSWKVRRAAIKVVRAFVVSRPELLVNFFEQCSTALLVRFKEREDSVKLDIINCYEDLLLHLLLHQA